MVIVFIQVFQLNQNVSFSGLCYILTAHFGFTFLQDVTDPIIGIFPKRLYDLSSALCYQRSDVAYNDHPQQLFNYQSTFEEFNTDLLNDFHQTTASTPLGGFLGGYIAFFSYDYAAQQYINISSGAPSSAETPTAVIGEYDIFFKKIDQIWTLYIDEQLQHTQQVKQLISQLQSLQSINANTTQSDAPFTLSRPLTPRWTKTDYTHAFQQVQDYLHAGDCYQINLTQQFESQVQSGQLLTLLPELLALTQAPFSGYFKFQDFELLSCSPELFIEFQPDRILKTRPIKGTLPRHANAKIDQQLKDQLAHSEKDQAENLMIVDLLRNDLSVYAETGSVKVPHLFEIESFAQVHHMVSEIQATLKPEVNLFEVLLAALPGGSITGAPKIRAMQIIAELEGNTRGAYCGSLGYLNYDGTGRFNILIRSIQRYGNHLSIWAGGGITVASNVDAEYQECLDKVSALLNFLNQYVVSEQHTSSH